MARPRIKVDYAILLSLRDLHHLGWTRMADEYRRLTGRYISRDTVKRRCQPVEINGKKWVIVKKEPNHTIPIRTSPSPPDTK